MSSGVPTNPECVKAFDALKKGKGKVFRYIVFNFRDVDKEIILTETAPPETQYNDFLAKINAKPNDPFYAVFDFDYEIADGKRNKILFISYVPDSCKVKQRMLFASTKESIKKSINDDGLVDIHASTPSDLDPQAILLKVKQGK